MIFFLEIHPLICNSFTFLSFPNLVLGFWSVHILASKKLLYVQLHSPSAVFASSPFHSGFVQYQRCRCYLRLCLSSSVVAVASFFVGGDGFGFAHCRWPAVAMVALLFLPLFCGFGCQRLHWWHRLCVAHPPSAGFASFLFISDIVQHQC